jgi:hypothetical protein
LLSVLLTLTTTGVVGAVISVAGARPVLSALVSTVWAGCCLVLITAELAHTATSQRR